MITIIDLDFYVNILFSLFKILIFGSFIHRIIIINEFSVCINLSIEKFIIFMIIINILIKDIAYIIYSFIVFEVICLYYEIFIQVDSLYFVYVCCLFYLYN